MVDVKKELTYEEQVQRNIKVAFDALSITIHDLYVNGDSQWAIELNEALGHVLQFDYEWRMHREIDALKSAKKAD